MKTPSIPAPAQSAENQAARNGWIVQQGMLEKAFHFADFDQTMAFANAVAAIARTENHHPDMLVRYRDCRLRWCSHDVGTLTDHDYRCAMLVDRLLP